MQKNEQKKELKEAKEKLLSNCKDRKFGEAMLDRVVSLKGQLSVEPAIVFVSADSVVKEYDFEHFKLIRTKNEIIYKSNGYKLIVKPWLSSLYGQLDMLLNYKEKESVLTEEEKLLYTDLFNASMLILQIPLVAFTDDEFMFEMATSYIKYLNAMAEKSVELKEETSEDAEKNKKFDEAVILAEKFKEESK